MPPIHVSLEVLFVSISVCGSRDGERCSFGPASSVDDEVVSGGPEEDEMFIWSSLGGEEGFKGGKCLLESGESGLGTGEMEVGVTVR